MFSFKNAINSIMIGLFLSSSTSFAVDHKTLLKSAIEFNYGGCYCMGRSSPLTFVHSGSYYISQGHVFKITSGELGFLSNPQVIGNIEQIDNSEDVRLENTPTFKLTISHSSLYYTELKTEVTAKYLGFIENFRERAVAAAPVIPMKYTMGPYHEDAWADEMIHDGEEISQGVNSVLNEFLKS